MPEIGRCVYAYVCTSQLWKAFRGLLVRHPARLHARTAAKLEETPDGVLKPLKQQQLSPADTKTSTDRRLSDAHACIRSYPWRGARVNHFHMLLNTFSAVVIHLVVLNPSLPGHGASEDLMALAPSGVDLFHSVPVAV